MPEIINFLNAIFYWIFDICNPKEEKSPNNSLYIKRIALLFIAFFSFTLWAPPTISQDFSTSLEQGLVAWWPLDGNAIDASGNGNNGQVNGPVPCQDRFGNPVGAMCFNGALAHHINIGNQVKPPFPFTITAWVKPETVDLDATIIRNDLWSYYYHGAKVHITGTSLGGAYGDGGWNAPNSRLGTNTEPGIIVAGDWQHVAVVFNAHEDIRLYRNCIQYPVSGYAGSGATMMYSTANGAIGLGSPLAGSTQNYTGAIDDIRVYNRSLSSIEIDRFCQEGPPGWLGNTLQTGSSYEFSLEQGAQKTDSIQVFNPGDVSRSATLEIINPPPGLSFYLQSQEVVIAPGTTETVSLQIDDTSAAVGTYDGILLKVTVDDGSILYSNLTVYVTPSGAGQLPDLAITADDIGSVTNADGSVTLTATVCNRGNSPASNVAVQFQNFDIQVDETVIPLVPAKGCTTTSIIVPSSSSGDRLFKAVIDPSGVIPELDKDNNEANRIVRPEGSSGGTAGNILVISDMPSRVCPNSLFAITGQAVYDITVNGVRDMSYVVKGGSVQITADWSSIYGDTHTDISGSFGRVLLAPESIGNHSVTMTVTDNTFSGTGKFVFEVVECSGPGGQWIPLEGGYDYCGENPSPDPEYCINVIDAILRLWELICPSGNCKPIPERDVFVYSEHIAFSNNHPDPNEEMTIGAQIHYSAMSSDQPSGKVTVNFHVTAPGSSGMELPQKVVDSISAGNSKSISTNWTAPTDGIYIVEVEAVPTEITENTRNNAATRAIIVGQYASGHGAGSGQVTDDSGSVRDVQVRLFDDSGTLGSTLTDDTGFYLFENVPMGDYQVQIVVPPGYAEAEVKTANVADQSVSTVDFHLTTQPADITPPTITPTVSGTLGNNGWYVSNVAISWEVTDNESEVNLTTGCEPTTVSTDTPGETFTCSATSSGGTTSEMVTIQRDVTLPTITGSVNAGGWHNSPVTVSFSCTDAMAGIATCTDTQTLSSEGANQSVNGTATDKAGNSANTSVTGINIDRTPPLVSVTGVIEGESYPLGSVPPAGCATTDALSGVQINATLSVTGGDANGLGTFTASCTGAMDKASNPGTTASVTYQVHQTDNTPPVIIPTVTGTLGNNGWYISNVTISWTVTDGESTITSQSGCDTTTVASDTAGVTLTCTASSSGGTASESVIIKRDATQPAVNVTGVANGASYPFGSVPTASCTTADAFSGVQTQAALSVTGGDANGLGIFTASCTGAMDEAGNPGTTASVTYQVTGTPSSTSVFSAFNMNLLRINQRLKTVFLLSNFTLGPDSDGINPVTEPVTLAIDGFTVTIPADSFRQGSGPVGVYAFAGKINKVAIEALITPLGNNRFGFQVAAYGANLNGTTNPVTVGLMIGNDSGTISITNAIIR